MNATVSTDSEAMLERLFEADIVAPTDNQDRIRLTETFETAVEEWRKIVDGLDEAGLRDELPAVVDDSDKVEELLDVARTDSDLVATYLAVAHTAVADFSHVERLHLLTALDSVGRSPPPDHGAPETFVPVHGERLNFLLRIHRTAVVYIWLDACEDCSEMKAVLDDVCADYADDTALLSVYGPDCADFLHEEFDVPGGPATLFVLDGEVDSRLYGAHYEEMVRSELDTLVELG